MDYSRIYDQLITRGQLRQAGLSKTEIVAKIGYVERHHIIPRSMTGTNQLTNLVYLTPEEHYFAHGLLVKMHPTVIALLRALMILSGGNKRNVRNNKVYGWARRRYSEMRKGAIPWNKDKSGSQVAWNKGVTTPDEVCAKLAKRKMKQVSVMGVIYDSLAEAALANGFGKNYNRVTNRCKSNLYPEWFFVNGIIEKRTRKGSPKGPMSDEAKKKMKVSKKEISIPAWNKGLKLKTEDDTYRSLKRESDFNRVQDRVDEHLVKKYGYRSGWFDPTMAEKEDIDYVTEYLKTEYWTYGEYCKEFLTIVRGEKVDQI